MKNFTIVTKKTIIIVIYIILWHLLTEIINNKILIASPYETFIAMIRIVKTDMFINILSNSIFNIIQGFLFALVFGVVMAFASLYYQFLRYFLQPLIHMFKSVPVASFVIIMLIWMGSEGIAKGISFIISLPIIYTNVLEGLKKTDRLLIEMSDVFHMKRVYKIYYIYFLGVKERIGNAACLAVGMCFKAGVAAEVIGVARNTLGEQIYLSKIYLNTDELFGWTIIIMLLAYIFESIIKLLFNYNNIKEVLWRKKIVRK